MRAAIPVVLTLLSLTPAARADATPPPFTYIFRDVVLEFVEPYPGWKFFAVSGDSVQPVSTTIPVALSELLGDNYCTRRMGVVAYAVPDDLFAEAGGSVSAKWLNQNFKNPHLRVLNLGGLSLATTIADPRERVVETYRVTLTPTSLDAEFVSQEAKFGWGSLTGGAVCLLIVGLIWGLVWCVRRLFRRPPVVGPPPSPAG